MAISFYLILKIETDSRTSIPATLPFIFFIVVISLAYHSLNEGMIRVWMELNGRVEFEGESTN